MDGNLGENRSDSRSYCENLQRRIASIKNEYMRHIKAEMVLHIKLPLETTKAQSEKPFLPIRFNNLNRNYPGSHIVYITSSRLARKTPFIRVANKIYNTKPSTKIFNNMSFSTLYELNKVLCDLRPSVRNYSSATNAFNCETAEAVNFSPAPLS